MRSSMFKTRSLHSSRNSHVDHSILIHGSTQIIRQSHSIDSNVDLFMYLIEAEGLGSVCLIWASGIPCDHFFTVLTSVIMILSLGK